MRNIAHQTAQFKDMPKENNEMIQENNNNNSLTLEIAEIKREFEILKPQKESLEKRNQEMLLEKEGIEGRKEGIEREGMNEIQIK